MTEKEKMPVCAEGEHSHPEIVESVADRMADVPWFMLICIALIIGFIAVAAVVLIIDMPKYAKKKREELEGVPACTPVLVGSEQGAEAAAAQSEEIDGKKE